MEELSDVGSVLMGELPVFADVVDGRNNGKSRNQSAHFGASTTGWGYCHSTGLGRRGRSRSGQRKQCPLGHDDSDMLR